MKLKDFGENIFIVPVPAGNHGLLIHGKVSAKMFALDDDGKTIYFYYPN